MHAADVLLRTHSCPHLQGCTSWLLSLHPAAAAAADVPAMQHHPAAPPMVYIMAPEMPSMMYCPFMRCGMNVTGFTLPKKHHKKHGHKTALGKTQRLKGWCKMSVIASDYTPAAGAAGAVH
jgi:hypothetical protein